MIKKLKNNIEKKTGFNVSVTQVSHMEDNILVVEYQFTVTNCNTLVAWFITDTIVIYNLQIAGRVSIYDIKKLVDAIMEVYENETRN